MAINHVNSPRGAVQGLTFVWSTGLLEWVVWDGSLTTGALTIGTVNQGIGGASPWLVSSSLSSDRTATAAITSTQAATISTEGTAAVGISIRGTWTGQLNFEASIDGTNYFSVNVTPIYPISAPVNATSGNVSASVSVGGFNKFRVIGATVTSGSATVALDAGVGANVVGVSGTLTHNSTPPTAGLIGVMPAIASELPPAYSEGVEVLLSSSLDGGLRVTSRSLLTPAAPTSATVDATSGAAVASNAARRGLVLTNTSTNLISLGLGATAVLGSGITLNASGGVWVMDEFTFTTAAINAIAGAEASNLAIQEFT